LTFWSVIFFFLLSGEGPDPSPFLRVQTKGSFSMHHLFSLLQTLLLILFVLRLLEELINSLSRFKKELHYTSGDALVLCLLQVIMYHPCLSPFCVSHGIVHSSLYTPHEKARLIILEFLMAFVRIMLLFPIRVLGVPNALEDWLVVHTYAELREKFGEIEFSERVMALLREDDEDGEEGFSTNEL
jgi:hypothetical protein